MRNIFGLNSKEICSIIGEIISFRFSRSSSRGMEVERKTGEWRKKNERHRVNGISIPCLLIPRSWKETDSYLPAVEPSASNLFRYLVHPLVGSRLFSTSREHSFLVILIFTTFSSFVQFDRNCSFPTFVQIFTNSDNSVNRRNVADG